MTSLDGKPTIEDLDASTQMVYWTGAVARNDVELEHELSGLYTRLATGLAWAALPAGVAPLANAIRRMIEADEDANLRVREHALKLVAEILGAHAERNRLVHDLWWGSPAGDAPVFDRLELRGRVIKGPSTRRLSDFRACAEQLLTCAFRVTALSVLLRDRDDAEGWPEQHNWWRVLTGHVSVSPGGGFSVSDRD